MPRFPTPILLLLATVGMHVVLLAVMEASPIKARFMCDMCESNFLNCLMQCNMEDYMMRHHYRGKVYMGKPKMKPKKNGLDMMFEHIMHQTGHNLHQH